MDDKILVVRDGIVYEFSIKTITTNTVTRFLNRYPHATLGDLQTVTIGNNILLEMLLEK